MPLTLPALPAKYSQTSCSPTILPDRALTRAEVAQLWAKDRALLVKCGYSLGGLIDFYVNLAREFDQAGAR